jgi:hypothetical protein
MTKILLTAVILLAAASARAQTGALWQKGDPAAVQPEKGAAPVADDETLARPEEGKVWGFTLKQKGFLGNQDYWMTDTYLDVAAPYGIDLNAELNDYANSTSSASPTVTFGGGWTSGLATFTGSYAITTLANNYQAAALDFGVNVKTDSQDFRTLLAVDGSETHHQNYTYIAHPVTHAPATKDIEDLSQLTPTASVSQRLWGNLDVKITLSDSSYNRDLLAYTTALNRTKTAGQRAFSRADSNLTGLIDGFPDYSEKFGLTYEFDAIALTLRGTYQCIHLEDTAQGTNTTADVTTYAADYDVEKWFTMSAEYDHTRQTSQTTNDAYGLIAELRY